MMLRVASLFKAGFESKGTTTVILNKNDKIQETKVQLNNQDHYKPLEKPMAEETFHRVSNIISELYQGKHIDNMTRKWLQQTPNPPWVPIFHTLTKIHKPRPGGRPIILGCDGPTKTSHCWQTYCIQETSFNSGALCVPLVRARSTIVKKIW